MSSYFGAVSSCHSNELVRRKIELWKSSELRRELFREEHCWLTGNLFEKLSQRMKFKLFPESKPPLSPHLSRLLTSFFPFYTPSFTSSLVEKASRLNFSFVIRPIILSRSFDEIKKKKIPRDGNWFSNIDYLFIFVYSNFSIRRN